MTVARRRIVIAGGSIAGITAAKELRKSGFDGTIHLLDRDPAAPYRRPAVSKAVLSAHGKPGVVSIPVAEDLYLVRHPGASLESLDVRRRLVAGQREGERFEIGYDGLIIATGAKARPWPIARGLGGIFTLRTLADAIDLRAALGAAQHLVIVGAGFIGLEVASVARETGTRVTVVEMADTPLSHVLGPDLGEHIAAMHRVRGTTIHVGVTVTEVHGSGSVDAVTLSDGRRLDADLVLACVGSAPEVSWLGSSGLDLGNGVVADHRCVVDPSACIVAAGDVVSWHNPLYDRRMRVEHWANALEQGAFAARALLGTAPADGLSSVPYFWSEQCGTRLQSVGTSSGYDETVILSRDAESMAVAYGRAGTLTGAAGIGVGSAILGYRPLVEQRAALASVASRTLVVQS
jgi:NADPH-dependent 2,4-dienoyl-CoA reductase/sulfur reductase-like enzyme